MIRPYHYADGSELRYLAVARLRLRGLDNHAIADRLNLDLATVRAAVRNARVRGIEIPRLRSLPRSPKERARAMAEKSRRNRQARIDAGRCINGPLTKATGWRRGLEHGAPVSGGKCQRCIDAHKRSA